MTARNPKAVEDSQAVREKIRHFWFEWVQRAPFARPPTAKIIKRHLTVRLSDSAVRWHMREIRKAADVEFESKTNALAPRQCID